MAAHWCRRSRLRRNCKSVPNGLSQFVAVARTDSSCRPIQVLGVRVASALAVIIALLVDILGAGAGVGRLLVESQQHFDASAAWGLLLIVGCFGYLMSLLLSLLERRVGVATESDTEARQLIFKSRRASASTLRCHV